VPGGGFQVNPGTWTGGLNPLRCMVCGQLSVHTRAHPSAPHAAGVMCGDCFFLLSRFDHRPHEHEQLDKPFETIGCEDTLRDWLNGREGARRLAKLKAFLDEVGPEEEQRRRQEEPILNLIQSCRDVGCTNKQVQEVLFAAYRMAPRG